MENEELIRLWPGEDDLPTSSGGTEADAVRECMEGVKAWKKFRKPERLRSAGSGAERGEGISCVAFGIVGDSEGYTSK
jgi:hypothetical protein